MKFFLVILFLSLWALMRSASAEQGPEATVDLPAPTALSTAPVLPSAPVQVLVQMPPQKVEEKKEESSSKTQTFNVEGLSKELPAQITIHNTISTPPAVILKQEITDSPGAAKSVVPPAPSTGGLYNESGDPVFPKLESDKEASGPSRKWGRFIMGAGLGMPLEYSAAPYSYQNQGLKFAAQASFALMFSRSIGLNGFVGFTPSAKVDEWYAGAELEFIPVHLPVGRVDVIELGVLAGCSNLTEGSRSRYLPHAGLRMNFNFTEDLGFTTAARVNRQMVGFEAGIITRF